MSERLRERINLGVTSLMVIGLVLGDRYHLMGAYKRHMLAAAESQPWDDTEHLRDRLVMDGDAYEEAQLLARGVDMRPELRFAIATWHRRVGE